MPPKSVDTAGYLAAAKQTVKDTKVKTKTELHAIYNMPIVRNVDNIAAIYIEYEDILHEILVDDEDYYRLLCCDKLLIIDKYVYVIKYKHQFIMHRFILNYEGEKDVDHIYGNKFDNRKSQLRLATHQENMCNRSYNIPNKTSIYTGVFKRKLSLDLTATTVWRANISYNYQRIIIGDFDTEANAGKARDLATVKYFKEFGRLNFPDNILEYNANQEHLLYVKYMSALLPDNVSYRMEINIRMVKSKAEIAFDAKVAAFELKELNIAQAKAAIIKYNEDYEITRAQQYKEFRAAVDVSEADKAKIKAMTTEELLASFNF